MPAEPKYLLALDVLAKARDPLSLEIIWREHPTASLKDMTYSVRSLVNKGVVRSVPTDGGLCEYEVVPEEERRDPSRMSLSNPSEKQMIRAVRELRECLREKKALELKRDALLSPIERRLEGIAKRAASLKREIARTILD